MMSPADMCNAAFELFGGVFVLNHCRALFEAKIVKGISIVSTVSESVLIMKEAAPNFSSSGVQSNEKKN